MKGVKAGHIINPKSLVPTDNGTESADGRLVQSCPLYPSTVPYLGIILSSALRLPNDNLKILYPSPHLFAQAPWILLNSPLHLPIHNSHVLQKPPQLPLKPILPAVATVVGLVESVEEHGWYLLEGNKKEGSWYPGYGVVYDFGDSRFEMVA